MVNARPRATSASYLESIPILLPPIFEQVQHTTANHRKNIISLRNIQEQCSGITEATPKGLRVVGEKAFNTVFIDMVNRILPVKKGVAVADRVVKFVANYVAYTTQQGQLYVVPTGEVTNMQMLLRGRKMRKTPIRPILDSYQSFFVICYREWSPRTRISDSE